MVRGGLPLPPYLLALAMSANIGSVATLVGNPQNMIIGAAAHGSIGFAQYLALTLPILFAGLFVPGRAAAATNRPSREKPGWPSSAAVATSGDGSPRQLRWSSMARSAQNSAFVMPMPRWPS